MAAAGASSVVSLSTFSVASISNFGNSNYHNGNKINNKHNATKLMSTVHRRHRPIVNNPTEFANVRCSSSSADSTFSRKDFPDHFLFGASSSAIQIESAARAGGRGESFKDYFLAGGSAAQSLYKYNEDILCLANMGADVYRFSISWPRLFPSGIVSDENLNKEGLEYYINLFELLKLNNITPIVTILHFDMPKDLEKYRGTLSHQFVEFLRDYADFCFKTFGTYVKHWITINEPHIWSVLMYPPSGSKEHIINGIDPYKNAFNLLNAHAQVVKLYRQKYQSDGGKIGIALNAEWFLPFSDTRDDKMATVRAWDFMVGWFLDPIVFGDYPFTMKMIVGDRINEFNNEQKEALKGSCDFIGINYYMSHYAKSKTTEYPLSAIPTYTTDMHYTAEIINDKGHRLGPPAEGNPSMAVYPQGLTDVLMYLKTHYGNPLVYITENGYPKLRKYDGDDKPHNMNDEDRIDYITKHLKSILKAIKEGSNVSGYCVWNIADCMEFNIEEPYGFRFGLNFTEYDSDYSRIPKKSASWYKKFLTRASTDE